MQSAGIPDLLAFLPSTREPGRLVLVCVECKRRGGRLRPEQAIFRERCRAAGVAHVVGDLDAVIAFLVEQGFLRATQVPSYRQPVSAP